MATIDCEITEKTKDTNHQKTEDPSGELKNGNIVINVDPTDSCQTEKGGKSACDERGNGVFENGKKNTNLKGENGVEKTTNDLLAVPLPKSRHRMSFMEEESAKEKLRLAILQQCFAILKQREEVYTKESLHRTFQDLDLLERVFRLFDTDHSGYLVQDDWFEFLKQRLTEEKQKVFVEQVESVAYALCGNDHITLDVFQRILQNRVVTKVLFRALDTDSDGYVKTDEVMDFISAVSSARPRVGFDARSVDRLEQLFRRTVGDQQEITKEQFHSIMDSKNPFFTERVFQIFDENNSGSISLQEFIAAVHQFGGHAPEDKIRFLFKVYDMDNDGLIQRRELEHVMRVCMEESGMSFSSEQLDELAGALLDDAHCTQDALSYEDFERLLAAHGALRDNITIIIDRWLVPPTVEQNHSFLSQLRRLKPYQLSLPYLRNNYVLVSYLAVFFAVNLILFVTRCVQYGAENIFTILARGCGQCLNFVCAWILVLMLRHSITFLRVRGLSTILPLDHHIYLHKLTGVLVFVLSVVHTIMHLCNFSLIVVHHPVLNAANYTVWEWLLTPRPGVYGLVGGWANPSGVVLAVVLLVLFLCSQNCVRRGGRFKIFYWTHLLYIPFWLLLLVHGPNFYKWFAVPGAIYLAERIWRTMMSQMSKTYVSSGMVLPSRVTHLVIKRPRHFTFHAGDYVFINIPAIANYEWHPFTISSAPELEGYLWVHVRGVGEWTNRLYQLFEEEQERLRTQSISHDNFTRNGSTLSAKSNKSRGKRFGSLKKMKKVSIELRPAEYKQMDEDKESQDGDAKTDKIEEVTSPHKHLEKSKSMPDVQTRTKNNPRDFLRSESDHFPPSPVPPSPLPPPSHEALTRQFRYLRTKPSIISFKTPSFEDAQRRTSNDSIITLARRRLSKSISPDKDPETLKDIREEHSFDPEALSKVPIGKPLEIYLDGPYGAASSHIFQAEHAALIAAGIGVTPFASILQAIMYRYWRARSVCPRCDHRWTERLPDMTLKKVDFFWINREQRSFEWFVSLLSQLEMEQAEAGGDRFLEMHMYITSALQRTDMKALGLQLALDMLHQKEKRDLITGLKTRTNAGRPNWDKVFSQLQSQRKGQVTVFYCGPPQLARTLRDKCNQYGFHFRKEVF